jgi:uncharacterized Tic20 family protein
VNVRAYGWYLASFASLVASGACIGIAGFTLFESLQPMYYSIALSVVAIVLAVIAWVRFPKTARD